MITGAAVDYLRNTWEELRDVRFEIASLPLEEDNNGIPRWRVEREHQRIIIYRVPLERLARLHREDAWHRAVSYEMAVFQAAAAYLDRDPWELFPEGFGHF